MGFDLFEILWVNGVENIEEILTIWLLAAWVFVLEMDCKAWVSLELWPQMFYSKLIPVRNVDVIYYLLLQDYLFISENLLEKYLIDLAFRRQVILCCIEIR